MGLRELENIRSGGCGDRKNTTGLAGSACGNVKLIAVFGAAGIMVTTTVYIIYLYISQWDCCAPHRCC